MRQGDAADIVSLMRAAWPDFYLDAAGEQAWERFLTDLDGDTAMQAFERLRNSDDRRPSMHAFREVYMMFDRERGGRDADVVEEAERQTPPPWYRAWRLARADGDDRVMSWQRPGYDAQQEANPAHRTYVWAEQEQMPPDDEQAYFARADSMTLAEVEEYDRRQAMSRQRSQALPDISPALRGPLAEPAGTSTPQPEPDDDDGLYPVD